jgi:hypothetical protein
MGLNQKNEPCAHCANADSLQSNHLQRGLHASRIRTSFNIILRMTIETVIYGFPSNTDYS